MKQIYLTPRVSLLFIWYACSFFLLSTAASAQTQYCTTGLYTIGCTANDKIDLFTFATINNATTICNVDGYSDYTNISATVNRSSTYQMTMRSNPASPQGFGVWIDYNADKDFDDAGEMIYNSAATGTQLFSTSVSIPGSAVVGTTRLRVRSIRSAVPVSNGACTQFTYGETEDYTIVISPLQQYCTTGLYTNSCSGSTNNFVISNVTLGTINNGNSNCPSSNRYSNFTNISTTLQLGSTYSYSVTTTNSSSGMMQSIGIWIDYNRDFDFEDPGEFVLNRDANYSPFTGTLRIAQNGTPGSVRMRIRSSTNYSITAGQSCTKFPYGETEDYTLNLTGTTQYCTLNLHGNSCGSAFNYQITNFNLANLSNNSTCGPNGYQDFANLTANLERGQTYPLSITGSSNMGFGIWIDLNKDLSFDVDEFVYQSPATNASSVTSTLTLPATGPLGTMRMRVRAFPSFLPLRNQACSFNSLGETEDYTVNISAPPSPVDAGVAAITKLKNSCGLGTTETVGAIVKNLGTTTQTNFPVKYSVNGILVGTETVTKVLAPGDTTAITFATKANLSITKTHKIKAWTNLTADAQDLNDTTSVQIDNFGNGITAFPATETFESFVPEFTPIGNIATGIFKNGWTNAIDDNFDWLTSGSATRASHNKSANGDHTTGQGNYLNFFPYGSNIGTANLESPCITLGSLQTPVLEFWYHMYGGTTGSLSVDVNVGGTWTQNIFTLNGSQQAQQSLQWLKASVPLAAYKGKTIRLRFRATLLNINSTAIAIDDVRILDQTAVLNDVGVSGIIKPTPSGCDKSTTEQVCVNLSNYGNTVRKNFTVAYKINNQAAVSEVFADSLLPGQSKQFCFQGRANFSAAGTYKFRTFTQLAGDQDLMNDTVKLSILNKVSAANFTFNNTSGSTFKFTTQGINTGAFIKWYFGDGDSSTVMMPTHQYLAPGTYTVKMVADDYQGCRTTIQKVITVTVSGLSKEFASHFTFFPNPAFEQVTITFKENAVYNVEIISLLGQKLINRSVPAGTTEIKMKLNDLSAGIYILRIMDTERSYTQPIIIHK